MMTDIVERLRQRPWRSAAESDYEAKERRQREREEGADTITALRAEVERLRSALRGSYEVYAGSDGFIPATAAEGYQQQIIKQMVDCISAALEEKP